MDWKRFPGVEERLDRELAGAIVRMTNDSEKNVRWKMEYTKQK